jgi:hypothetical protein
MALKTGFSHALATLILTLLSALLVAYLNTVGIFNHIFTFLNVYTLKISQWLETTLKMQIPHELIVPVMVASVMAFVWGLFFHIVRHRR